MSRSTHKKKLAEDIMANRSDYYAVLRVPKTAEAKEIRRSYYKLSLELHPDRNPGNSAADAAYRVVNNCYETLNDPNKRQLYDMYGEEGLARFSHFADDMPPVWDILKFAVTYCAYLIVRRAAMRSACSEVVDEVFPTTAAATASVQSESNRAFWEQHEYAKAHAQEKRRARRALRKCIVAVSLLLFALAAVDRYWRPVFPSTWSSFEESRSAVSVSETERVRQLQEELLYPQPLRRGMKAKRAKSVKPVVMTVRGACLALSDARDTLCCQASQVANDDDDLATNVCANTTELSQTDRDFTVTFTRYGGNAPDSLTAFHALVWTTCEREALFAAASRDRFRETTTLTRRGPLPAPRSPNKAAKRKYAEKRWRPKFAESFSVTGKEELFHMSPLCTALIALREGSSLLP